MMEHFALDRLAEYGSEPLPGTAKVINPAWRKLSNEKQSVRTKLTYRQARFAECALQEDNADAQAHDVSWKLWWRKNCVCHRSPLPSGLCGAFPFGLVCNDLTVDFKLKVVTLLA